ncbi:hypothetical protein N0V88_005293 [Collariella sp. IMI 366227]|nr:hypothetical protein N0V88_005293 [Collariella sp. IMI 366227]
MRRRAKTPILSIGQLETIPRPGNALGRTSSVDLIAEQYRAVLESRRSSTYSDTQLEPQISSCDSDLEASLMAPCKEPADSGYHSYELPLHHPSHMAVPDYAKPSPTSDDGTLVSFQDDTDNVSLQICLELLTRELSAAVAGRPSHRLSTSMGTSALQIWVMIEAYERLRDQMAELSGGNEQARRMEMMFDMWLRALYGVHEALTGQEGGALEAEDLD